MANPRQAHMSEPKITLDEWVGQHYEYCTCEMLFDWTPALCDCGQPERVAELALLQKAVVKDIVAWNAMEQTIASLSAESLENEGIVSEWQKAAHDAQEYGNEWQRCAQAKDEQIARLRAENKELARVAAEAMKNADKINVQLRAELATAQDESLAFKVIADLRADLAAAQKRWKEVYDGNEILMALVRIAQKREESARGFAKELVEDCENNQELVDLICCCSAADDSVGLGAIICEYHAAAAWLAESEAK